MSYLLVTKRATADVYIWYILETSGWLIHALNWFRFLVDLTRRRLLLFLVGDLFAAAESVHGPIRFEE